MTDGIVKIHGKEYRTVAYRVNEFRLLYGIDSGYGIETVLVHHDSDKVIMKAIITAPGGGPVATGYAEEVRSASKINKTSALENAETSAIGRALAAAGLAGTEYASADEVAAAIAQQNQPKREPTELDQLQAWGQVHMDKIVGLGFDGEWGQARTLSEHKALQDKIKAAHSALEEQQNNNEGE